MKQHPPLNEKDAAALLQGRSIGHLQEGVWCLNDLTALVCFANRERITEIVGALNTLVQRIAEIATEEGEQ